MRKDIVWVVLVIVTVLILLVSLIFGAVGMMTPPAPANTEAVLATAAASPEPIRTPFPSPTPDPCSPQALPDEVAKLHALTREFEDTAQILTSTLLRDSSIPLVQQLQAIRRAAEDQQVPACLQDLKAAQINHMNARIDVFGTALSFLNTYGPEGDQSALNQVLEPLYIKAELAARQYENELSRLLGLPTPVRPALETVTPTP